MKINYIVAQQSIARLLLISICLQSCGGSTNSFIPIENGITHTQEIISQTNIQALVNQALVAKGGYAITFYKEAHGLKAEVIEENGSFSKTHTLPVYIEPSISLKEACKKEKVQVALPKKQQPGYVYIGNLGLKGGMEVGNEGEGSGSEVKSQKNEQGKLSRLKELKGEEELLQDKEESKRKQAQSKGQQEEKEATIKAKKERRRNNQKARRKEAAVKRAEEKIRSKQEIEEEKGDMNAGGELQQEERQLNKQSEEILQQDVKNLKEKEEQNYFDKLECYKKEAGQQVKSCTKFQQAWCEKAAKQVDAGMQFMLGMMYAGEKDCKQASGWMKQAAQQGVKEAQSYLANMYYNGQGVEKDYTKAFRWCKRAAQQQDMEAQYKLGSMYHQGVGVKKDFKEALAWMEQAAQQGYPPAQYYLGLMYYDEGVDKDYVKALEWYEKAAKQGDRGAQYNLGLMYCNGDGVERDYEKAFEWYEKSANQGGVEAQYQLGLMYDKGWGVEKDYTKAFRWYEKAADQGDPVGQYNLGCMYLYGEGVEKDYEKAFAWFQKAAKQGHAKAQYNLGMMYDNGEGVEKNYTKAFIWYQKAVKQEDPLAQFNLGDMYCYGEGVKKDYKKAFEWFSKAAKQGDKKAQYGLGWLYYNGYGVGKDYIEAKHYFELANTPKSIFMIGSLYENGYIEAVPPHKAKGYKGDTKLINYQKALEYYSRSEAAEAKLRILYLFQLEYIKANSLEEKQQIIHEINGLLPSLAHKDRCYIQGMTAYYLGDWEAALIHLQQAFALGNEEKESILSITKSIEDFLEKENLGFLLVDKTDATTSTSSISMPVTSEKPIKGDETASPVDAETTNSISEGKFKPKQDNSTVKLTKEQKKMLRSTRIKLQFLNTSIRQSKDTHASLPPSQIEFVFLNNKQKEKFLTFKEEDKRVEEVLEDIQSNQWNTAGIGRPEVLKYTFKKRKGCISRRLNDEDRLVYKVVNPGQILILAWKGHYKKP